MLRFNNGRDAIDHKRPDTDAMYLDVYSPTA